MERFSTCKKLISFLASRREASTFLLLEESERPKVLVTLLKQTKILKNRIILAVVIKMLYNT